VKTSAWPVWPVTTAGLTGGALSAQVLWGKKFNLVVTPIHPPSRRHQGPFSSTAPPRQPPRKARPADGHRRYVKHAHLGFIFLPLFPPMYSCHPSSIKVRPRFLLRRICMCARLHDSIKNRMKMLLNWYLFVGNLIGKWIGMIDLDVFMYNFWKLKREIDFL
jgi:hypothetical protein